jgi:hypothetical protein
MVDGILYIARGASYVEAAAESARSVRVVSPGLPIALATDGTSSTEFDETIQLSESDVRRAKILGLMASPFDRTLYLDVDTYAADDVSELFTLLDVFDLAVAHAPMRVPDPLDDVPDSFPELNAGVIAFRRSANVQRFLHSWLREYESEDAPLRDQRSFRRALYTATDVRPAVLPPEFNLRFWMAGYYNQRVRILHGWGDQAIYGEVAALLNGRVKKWRHQGVFIGSTLFGKRAQIVGRFPDLPKRVKLKNRHASN